MKKYILLALLLAGLSSPALCATNTNVVVSSSVTLTNLTARVTTLETNATALATAIATGTINVNGVPLAQLGGSSGVRSVNGSTGDVTITLSGLGSGSAATNQSADFAGAQAFASLTGAVCYATAQTNPIICSASPSGFMAFTNNAYRDGYLTTIGVNERGNWSRWIDGNWADETGTNLFGIWTNGTVVSAAVYNLTDANGNTILDTANVSDALAQAWAAGLTASNVLATVSGYGNIVTHNVSEFASAFTALPASIITNAPWLTSVPGNYVTTNALGGYTTTGNFANVQSWLGATSAQDRAYTLTQISVTSTALKAYADAGDAACLSTSSVRVVGISIPSNGVATATTNSGAVTVAITGLSAGGTTSSAMTFNGFISDGVFQPSYDGTYTYCYNYPTNPTAWRFFIPVTTTATSILTMTVDAYLEATSTNTMIMSYGSFNSSGNQPVTNVLVNTTGAAVTTNGVSWSITTTNNITSPMLNLQFQRGASELKKFHFKNLRITVQ